MSDEPSKPAESGDVALHIWRNKVDDLGPDGAQATLLRQGGHEVLKTLEGEHDQEHPENIGARKKLKAAGWQERANRAHQQLSRLLELAEELFQEFGMTGPATQEQLHLRYEQGLHDGVAIAKTLLEAAPLEVLIPESTPANEPSSLPSAETQVPQPNPPKPTGTALVAVDTAPGYVWADLAEDKARRRFLLGLLHLGELPEKRWEAGQGPTPSSPIQFEDVAQHTAPPTAPADEPEAPPTLAEERAHIVDAIWGRVRRQTHAVYAEGLAHTYGKPPPQKSSGTMRASDSGAPVPSWDEIAAMQRRNLAEAIG